MKWIETGEPDYIITNLNKYKKIWIPCIYAWIRYDTWLYVGYSNQGTYRINKTHQKINNLEPFLIGDKIYIYFFPYKTPKTLMLQYEKEFIQTCNPKYNIAYNDFIPLGGDYRGKNEVYSD